MQISAPIYRLKRQARALARRQDIPLHQALDQQARQEGYQSWSHLSAMAAQTGPAAALLPRLRAGDMVLLGARPGQGKTLLGLELAARAPGSGRAGWFFTLDCHDRDVADRLAELGIARDQARAIRVDASDGICADHIIGQLRDQDGPALIVIDYLQLLDQKRSHPPLADQIVALRGCVRAGGHVCVTLSQIDRRFDLSRSTMPGRADIRLPNPLDLAAFDRFCFLHDGVLHLDSPAEPQSRFETA